MNHQMKLFERTSKSKTTSTKGNTAKSDVEEDNDDGYISMKAAAQLLGVYPNTVAAWYDNGHLDGYVTPTGLRKVKRSSVEKLLRNKRKTR